MRIIKAFESKVPFDLHGPSLSDAEIAFRVPKLNLAESLGLKTDREASHQVRQVDHDTDISWGTPPETQRSVSQKDLAGKTAFKPAIHQVSLT